MVNLIHVYIYIRNILNIIYYYILLANVYDGRPPVASCHHHCCSVLESERPIMRPPAVDVTAIMLAQAPTL